MLAPGLTLVDLTREQHLQRRGGAAEFVYFLEGGVACTFADDAGRHGVEIGMIGREGFAGVFAVLGATHNACDVYMQSPGAAHRISAAVLRAAMDESSALRQAMLDYVHEFLVHIMREAHINARATLEARLARLLLMMHDRLDGDELHLTHDRLASMLGVRRAGVSVAAKKLERGGVIALHRGSIMVRDRSKLEEGAGGVYGATDRVVRR